MFRFLEQREEGFDHQGDTCLLTLELGTHKDSFMNDIPHWQRRQCYRLRACYRLQKRSQRYWRAVSKGRRRCDELAHLLIKQSKPLLPSCCSTFCPKRPLVSLNSAQSKEYILACSIESSWVTSSSNKVILDFGCSAWILSIASCPFLALREQSKRVLLSSLAKCLTVS